MSLLEVLAAVALIGIAGVAMVGLVRDQLATVADSRSREVELAEEERLMAAYALLARGDLDLRLGGNTVGIFRVIVSRPERNLYRIAIARGAAPDVEDLVTVVRRAGER